MRIYLDNSFLNRPFDDPTIKLNRIEAEILLLIIIQSVQTGRIQFVNSSVIEFENSFNPFLERKRFVEKVMQHTVVYQNYTEEIQKRAMILGQEFGLKPLDALHVASAEVVQVDFFITCDYALVRHYRGSMRIVTPLVFLNNYGKHD